MSPFTDASDRRPRTPGYSVIPDKPSSVPVVMGLSEHEAQRAAMERNTRPSTRRGLNSGNSGPGSYTVVSDDAVSASLPGGNLAEAKRQLHTRRDQNRDAQRRHRARKRSA